MTTTVSAARQTVHIRWLIIAVLATVAAVALALGLTLSLGGSAGSGTTSSPTGTNLHDTSPCHSVMRGFC